MGISNIDWKGIGGGFLNVAKKYRVGLSFGLALLGSYGLASWSSSAGKENAVNAVESAYRSRIEQIRRDYESRLARERATFRVNEGTASDIILFGHFLDVMGENDGDGFKTLSTMNERQRRGVLDILTDRTSLSATNGLSGKIRSLSDDVK